MSIPFIDLAAQRRHLGDRIDRAVTKVIDHGNYILGPEVAELEEKLAVFAATRFCVTCANGTDALHLVLRAENIGPGDAVLVPAFTFVATAEAVLLTGATPVFVDVTPDTFCMDPASLEAGITDAKRLGLKPRMAIPVDLFGQPADYRTILPIVRRHGLKVTADAAQGFGATLDGSPALALADYATTSFFPAKPLGCYGDGGAVFTNDAEAAALLRSLRFHGKGSDKYDNVRVGLNSRLDTIQAAILLEKLAIFPAEIEARQRVADRYDEALRSLVTIPALLCGVASVWAQYTILVNDRAALAKACADEGVPTAIYYPIPLNRQTGYAHCPVASGGVPVSERLAEQVLSLPMHPYMDTATQDRIIAAVKKGLGV